MSVIKMYEVLKFLMEVAHEDGQSQAISFVREMTGIGTHK